MDNHTMSLYATYLSLAIYIYAYMCLYFLYFFVKFRISSASLFFFQIFAFFGFMSQLFVYEI